MFRDFHDKYGPIVRLGPKTIAVSDKDLIRDVLVTEDLPKGPLYKVFQGMYICLSHHNLILCTEWRTNLKKKMYLGHGKLSVFSATDKEWHKRRVNDNCCYTEKYITYHFFFSVI